MDTLLNDIIALGKKEALAMQSKITKFYAQNTDRFIDLVKEDNLEGAKHCMSQGVNWSASKMWHSIGFIWCSEGISPEMTRYVWSLCPDEKLSSRESDNNSDKPPMSAKVLQELWHAHLKQSLKDWLPTSSGSGVSRTLNPYLAQWMWRNRQQKLSDSPSFLNAMCQCLARGDVEKNVALVSQIVLRFPAQAFVFMEEVQASESFAKFQFLVQTPVFKEVIARRNMEVLSDQTAALLHCMNKAVSKGHVEAIAFYHDLGVEFPASKRAYSELCSSSKRRSGQEFMLSHLQDVSFFNHVMFKSALHHNDIPLMGALIERYENLEPLQDILNQYPANDTITLASSMVFNAQMERSLSHKKETVARIKI